VNKRFASFFLVFWISHRSDSDSRHASNATLWHGSYRLSNFNHSSVSDFIPDHVCTKNLNARVVPEEIENSSREGRIVVPMVIAIRAIFETTLSPG
jgi:hypothetical protein